MTASGSDPSSPIVLPALTTAELELVCGLVRQATTCRLPLWPAARRRARVARAALAALGRKLSQAPTIEQAWLAFDAEACWRWLHDGAAARYGIDEHLNRASLAAVGGLVEDLLVGLNDAEAPRVWAPQSGLAYVRMWRTGDNDGLDGGLLLVVNVHVGDGPVRICPMRLEPDELISEGRSGIDAAVEILDKIAKAVNRECATVFEAVTGSWAGRR